ncbi:MAG: hypothetical protein ACC707_17210, partial [Thiohalomonadales bacterium]
MIALLLTFPMLSACSDDLAELDKRLSESKNPTPSPGVYVKLSSDLQQAIAITNSQTTVQLRIVRTDSGVVEREQTLSITGDTASDSTELAEGEYRYHVQIMYSSANITEPLLLAAASKTSSAKRVEFSAAELQTTTAFDQNGDGTIDEAEKTALDFDFDGDTRGNLAELVEGGNPKNRDPTLLSPTILSIAEGYGRGDSFYTTVAISPRRDANGAPQTISYGIRNSETDPRLVDLITIDADSGELFINQGQELRYYPQGDNSYGIILTATDSAGTIALPKLTLTVTDIFNLTVQASIKALDFQWDPVSDSSGVAADYYKILEDINGDNSFKPVSIKDPDGTLIPLEFVDTQYQYNLSLHLT